MRKTRDQGIDGEVLQGDTLAFVRFDASQKPVFEVENGALKVDGQVRQTAENQVDEVVLRSQKVVRPWIGDHY